MWHTLPIGTLTRITTELAKMLCIYQLSKVKTLQYQLLTTRKKRKLMEELDVEEAEAASHQSKSQSTKSISKSIALPEKIKSGLFSRDPAKSIPRIVSD